MSQSQAIQKQPTDTAILHKVIMRGDLSDLTPEEQVGYYLRRCERLGLDPSSRPFDFLETYDKESGKKKVTLYPNKECAAQLIRKESVSIYQLDETEENGVYRATAYARMPDGRTMINKSVAKVKGLEGKNYENAIKRCVTQAIRRAILMACGLGDTDESEIGDIPNARPLPFPEQEEVVMTEQESLALSHRASGLDQWQCGRALAMQIITACNDLHEYKITDEIIKSWLPAGVTSRKDLNEGEARYFLENLNQRLKLMELCVALANKGVDKATLAMKLPNSLPDKPGSLLTLTNQQVEEAIKGFTHWLKSHEEVTNNA